MNDMNEKALEKVSGGTSLDEQTETKRDSYPSIEEIRKISKNRKLIECSKCHKLYDNAYGSCPYCIYKNNTM